jgi:hypothetical protein
MYHCLFAALNKAGWGSLESNRNPYADGKEPPLTQQVLKTMSIKNPSGKVTQK